MKITLEMLERYDACPEGIEFIEKNYPNGAEAMDLMKEPNMNIDWLHFAAQYFPYTEQELNRYKEICKIENSKHCFYSTNLKNCSAVMESDFISDSEFIRYCSHIKNSNNIYNSNNVTDSQNVNFGEKIKHSNKIIASKKVTYSNNIYNSDIISWSQNVFMALMIMESSYIYNSSNLQDCHFCGFLKNCSHCLFCSDLEDVEYYIFNTPVLPSKFERTKEQMMAYLSGEVCDFIRINDVSHDINKRFVYNTRPDAIFDGLNPNFFGWIGTIDEYDEDIFLQVFLTEKNLKNIKI